MLEPRVTSHVAFSTVVDRPWCWNLEPMKSGQTTSCRESAREKVRTPCAAGFG